MPNNDSGFQITRLEAASPFARAGLRLGDVVTKVNGRPPGAAGEMMSALNDGNAMIEFRRGSALTALAISCR